MRGTYGHEVDSAQGVVGFYVAGRLVVLDLEDFDRLQRLAPGAHWLVLDGSRGRVKVPGLRLVDGRRVVAARLIVDAGPFERVTYRSGREFDLRRGNLLVTQGAARVSRAPGSGGSFAPDV